MGAGCLSYEYITLRGMQEIRKAQVLIYDALIDTRLLDFTIENCEKNLCRKTQWQTQHEAGRD